MLELRSITHSYDGTPVLKDYSATFAEGITVLQGESGIGKSTLLRCISGLEGYDGEIILDGRILSNPAGNRPVAYMMQDANLFAHLDLESNVDLPAKLAGKPDPSLAKRLLKDVGLEGYEHRLPESLSGGQRQRASLARALRLDPRVLLLDEPFSSVDEDRKEELAALVRVASKGRILLIVSHDARDAQLLDAALQRMEA